jgi:glycolate oxidase iron-sulfur subunit
MTDTRGHPSLTAEADRCVKCGLCLPACPTYGLSRNEADSPRGRIALADALARGQLKADAALLGHLDSCLLCRSCENRCPSGVRYGRIIDLAREITFDQRPTWQRWAAGLLSKRRLARLGIALSRIVPDALLPTPKGLVPAARRLAARRHRVSGKAPADGPHVALFRGCVGGAVQASAIDAAQDLLQAAGARLTVPKAQGCCGAMHGHLGDRETAASLSEQNRHAFSLDGLDAIVSLASGCGTELADYDPPLAARHWDISQYLLESGLVDRLTLRPLDGHALVHIPCTQANRLGGGHYVIDLLSYIPGLQVSNLTAGSNCCGAAGLSLLSHPEQGEALRAPKISAIRDTQPDFLVTSNPGCALHLAAGLGIRGPQILHPVELLARQLDQGQ